MRIESHRGNLDRNGISGTIAAVVVVVIIVIAAIVAYEATSSSSPASTSSIPSTSAISSSSSTTTLLTTSSTTSSSSSTTSSSSSAAYTIKVVNSSTYGSYLVNGTGFTLYYFAIDTVGNATSPPVSHCTTAESCITVWPAFYAAHIVVPPGLNASDFTTFTRPDGTNQTAYMGHPLYYFVSDTSPGSVTGNAININGGYWYVASVNGTMP